MKKKIILPILLAAGVLTGITMIKGWGLAKSPPKGIKGPTAAEKAAAPQKALKTIDEIMNRINTQSLDRAIKRIDTAIKTVGPLQAKQGNTKALYAQLKKEMGPLLRDTEAALLQLFDQLKLLIPTVKYLRNMAKKPRGITLAGQNRKAEQVLTSFPREKIQYLFRVLNFMNKDFQKVK